MTKRLLLVNNLSYRRCLCGQASANEETYLNGVPAIKTECLQSYILDPLLFKPKPIHSCYILEIIY